MPATQGIRCLRARNIMHNILQSPYALQAFFSLRFRTEHVPSGHQCGHVFVLSTSSALYSSLTGINEMLSPADEPASIQRSARKRVQSKSSGTHPFVTDSLSVQQASAQKRDVRTCGRTSSTPRSTPTTTCPTTSPRTAGSWCPRFAARRWRPPPLRRRPRQRPRPFTCSTPGRRPAPRS